MSRASQASAKRPRISVDVDPEVRLREDLRDENEGVLGLTGSSDPVLAELWDNRKDAAYDRFPPLAL